MIITAFFLIILVCLHVLDVEAVFNPTPGNSGGVDQTLYRTRGNEWILAEYPEINLITDMLIPEKQRWTNSTNSTERLPTAA
eukprot:COSAG02_NODE_1989_length_10174_cov_12.502134_4_plen_82_part_00